MRYAWTGRLIEPLIVVPVHIRALVVTALCQRAAGTGLTSGSRGVMYSVEESIVWADGLK
jgi:hypothetical protein